MATMLDKNGKITITFVKRPDAPESDEETLIFWLFKVLRQFGLEASIDTDSNTYEEDEVVREL